MSKHSANYVGATLQDDGGEDDDELGSSVESFDSNGLGSVGAVALEPDDTQMQPDYKQDQQQKQQQPMLWIQRRRLERDRAREPPAWLRERPIRRDLEAYLVADDDNGADDDVGRLQTAPEEAQEPYDTAEPMPIDSRQTRGDQQQQQQQQKVRRLRDNGSQVAGENYEQILAHLLEEALNGYDFLADLYDDLEESRQQPTNGYSGLQASADQAVAGLQMAASGAGAGQIGSKTFDEQAAMQQATNNRNKLLRQYQRHQHQQQQQQQQQQQHVSAQQQAPTSSQVQVADGLLQVAGDEVSNNDDVILLLDEALTAKQSPLSSSTTPIKGNAQQQHEQQQLDNHHQVSAIGQSGGLIELLRSSSDSPPPPPGTNNEQFHVIEDVDLINNHQQSSSLPNIAEQQQQLQLIPLSYENDQMIAKWSPATDDEDPVLMRQQERQQFAKRSELNIAPRPLTIFKQQHHQMQANDDEDDNTDDDNNNNNNGLNASGNDDGYQAAEAYNWNSNDQQQLLRQLRPLGLSGGPRQAKSLIDSNANVLEMIQSGYFSREQLMRLATKLRIYLENALQFERNSIVGLFPLSPTQLKLQLDLDRLSPDNRINLMQSRNFNRLQGALTLQWNPKSRQNPLPVLAAILDAMREDPNSSGANRHQTLSGRQLASAGLQVEHGDDQLDLLEQVAANRQLNNGNDNNNNNDDSDSDKTDTDQADMEPVVVYPATESSSDDALKIDVRRNARQMLTADGSAAVGSVASLQQVADNDLTFDELLDILNEQMVARRRQQQQQQLQHTWAPSERLWAQSVASRRQDAAPLQKPRIAQQFGLPVSAATLLAYLNANQYLANGPVLLSPPQPAEILQQQLSSDEDALGSGLIVVQPSAFELTKTVAGQLHRLTPAASSLNQDNHTASSFIKNMHLVHLTIVIVALISSFFLVKLFMRRTDKQDVRRRRQQYTSWLPGWLWADKTGHTKDTDQGPGDDKKTNSGHHSSSAHEKQVEAGNPLSGHRLSADSGLETLNGVNETDSVDQGAGHCGQYKTRNLDLLSQRLLALLRPLDKSTTLTPTPPTAATTTTSTTDINDDIGQIKSTLDVEAGRKESTAMIGTTRFRTSRSYIKSLIDALTKARSRVFDGATQNDDDDDDDLENGATRRLVQSHDDDNDYDVNEDNAYNRGCCLTGRTKMQQVEEHGGGIVVSQMDISAAHLILDYMEKHLEDKERLRREWLELNGAVDGQLNYQQSANRSNNAPNCNNNTANRLILQRLAKVALSDDNRCKNRNPAIVPFDRNRVRLGRLQHLQASTSPPSSTTPPNGDGSVVSQAIGGCMLANNTTGSGPKHHQPRGAKAASASARSSPADYINASFIYDADPRSPTHIIAQGPDEQTIGKFWQMIWEQEVSVIVMLTRLNENGRCQCSCYWPTAGTGHQTNTTQAPTTDVVAPNDLINSSNSCNQQPQSTPTAVPGPNGACNQPSSPKQATTPPAGSAIRRGSVTSVFSSAVLVSTVNTNTASGNAITSCNPIIANACKLNDNNILYLDIPIEIGNSCNEQQQQQQQHEEEQEDEGQGNDCKQTKANNNNSNITTVRLEVHLISEHVSSSDYLVRNMYLINRTSGETRTITQFHYLAWPDGRVPDNVRSLLQFRRKVHKSYRNLKSPILVHCSDGAGRSGTYTLLDIILERIKNGAKEIDPRATLEHLRDQRIGLCATQNQFEFVLVALAEEIQLILNALPKKSNIDITVNMIRRSLRDSKQLEIQSIKIAKV